MSNPTAILIGTIILAATFAVIGRWEIVATNFGGAVVRLDKWTGAVSHCGTVPNYKCD